MNRTKWRKIRLWIGFLILWMIALGAVMVLSTSLIRLDRAERDARLDAAIEENLRLALWRIDSVLAPLLTQKALMPLQPAVGNLESPAPSNADTEPGIAGLPILASFRWTERAGDTAMLRGVEYELQAIRKTMALLPKMPPQIVPTIQTASDAEPPSLVAQNRLRATNEFNQRAQNYEFGNQVLLNNSGVATTASSPLPFAVLWERGQMLLVRDTNSGGPGLGIEKGLEGWLLDWEGLKSFMRTTIEDLLPEADFVPVQGSEPRSPDSLVSIPCLIQPGAVAGGFLDAVNDGRWPVSWILGLMWFAFLTTGLATGLALLSAQRLSDRREAFVAAVTHELRTPLTTLQLVSEMLGTGMIQDEESKKSYLETLQLEVQRIGHLIENVFTYARLERGRAPRDAVPTSMREKIERIEPKLTRIAEQSDMVLRIEESDVWDFFVAADTSLLEQILVNLVDNASKYAKVADDRRIHLEATLHGRDLRISVRDHGPGFPNGRLWKSPFSKSVLQAAESAPGIGLGLAISHRLAKQMRGRLIVESLPFHGARVTLAIPTFQP